MDFNIKKWEDFSKLVKIMMTHAFVTQNVPDLPAHYLR